MDRWQVQQIWNTFINRAFSDYWVTDHLVSNQVLELEDNVLIYNEQRQDLKGQQQVEKTCKVFSNLLFSLNGAPGEIRTPDRLVRSVPPEFTHPVVIQCFYAVYTVQ